MFRRLRVLAAFCMIPVVLLANPQTAAAAAGPWVPIVIDVPAAPLIGDSAPGTIDTIDCNWNMQNLGGYSIEIGANGACFGLPDVSWGYTQYGEAGNPYRISVTGESATGSCSGSMSSTLAQHPANGTLRVAGTITPSSMSVNQQDCTLTEVCITLGGNRTACTATNVPPGEEEEPPAGGSCPNGYPTSARLEVRSTSPDAYGVVKDELWFKWSRSATVSTATWGVGFGGLGGASETREVTGVTEIKLRESQRVKEAPRMTIPAQAGIQFWTYPDPHPTQKWNQALPYYQSTFIPTSPPNSSGSNFHGTTDPTHCRFYFGPKVLSFADTDIDEPFHDSVITDPPPPETTDPGPEPDPVQPVTINEPEDEKGWLKWLAALLRAIWGAISDGFGAITAWLRGVPDMFMDLFVPEDGYMDARFDSVQSDWEDTSPSKYFTAFSNLRAPSSNGCSGMPLDVTLAPGVRINESIGAACGGTMADVAAVVRIGLSAVIIVGGAFACVRGIGSGFGWDPGLGRGRTD